MSGDVAPVTLRAEDAWELAELLEFLGDWLNHRDQRLTRELHLFTGYGYDPDELRADLARFAFLLGGDGDRFVHGADR
jgi:hypothetical protein